MPQLAPFGRLAPSIDEQAALCSRGEPPSYPTSRGHLERSPREVTSRGHLERWKQATGISPAEGLRCGREPRPRSPTLRHPPPRLSNLGSIPGPLGLAICGYRNQVDHKVEKAAAGDHSGHDH